MVTFNLLNLMAEFFLVGNALLCSDSRHRNQKAMRRVMSS